MTVPPRPTPRPVFLEKPRRIRVHFYTSSIQKYVQARYIFELYGLVLTHFQHDRPYFEHEEADTRELIARGIDEILESVGSRSLFFIEDTSLRIEALSGPTDDVPGLRVKQWFASTSFAELDAQLPRDPEGRTAIVRSDIGLHVPGLPDPVYFHGSTSGSVALELPLFEEDPAYPWLTSKTFNGWFIPDGALKPLGAMSFDESWKYDFRGKSLASLVARLEEYAAVLNADSAITFAVERKPSVELTPSLFPVEQGRVFVVVGATCAGKTTFAANARTVDRRLDHIEASAVLRSTQRAHDRSDPFSFAKQALAEHGPDFVARRALSMYRLDQGGDFVVTGFRTIEEVLLLRRHCRDLKIVLVEASERTRYARHLARGRAGAQTLEGFHRMDEEQWAFGLLRVAENFCDYRVDNEGSLSDYRKQVRAVLAGVEIRGVTKNVRPQHRLSVHRLYRCLDILAESGRPMACDEIEEASGAPPRLFRERSVASPPKGRYTGKPISQNNVNKVLKGAPELAERLASPGERLRYRILPAGYAYLKLMNDLDEQGANREVGI